MTREPILRPEKMNRLRLKELPGNLNDDELVVAVVNASLDGLSSFLQVLSAYRGRFNWLWTRRAHDIRSWLSSELGGAALAPEISAAAALAFYADRESSLDHFREMVGKRFFVIEGTRRAPGGEQARRIVFDTWGLWDETMPGILLLAGLRRGAPAWAFWDDVFVLKMASRTWKLLMMCDSLPSLAKEMETPCGTPDRLAPLCPALDLTEENEFMEMTSRSEVLQAVSTLHEPRGLSRLGMSFSLGCKAGYPWELVSLSRCWPVLALVLTWGGDARLIFEWTEMALQQLEEIEEQTATSGGDTELVHNVQGPIWALGQISGWIGSVISPDEPVKWSLTVGEGAAGFEQLYGPWGLTDWIGRLVSRRLRPSAR